jgi:multidrug efflux pump subunit AcrA (membrane-fusion protein)
MQFLIRYRIPLIAFGVILLGGSLFFFTREEKAPDWVTSTVTRGDVRELVSVSGIIEAESEALLTFPATGIVAQVLVREGDTVDKDQVLAMLEQDELTADRQDAYAALMIARADRDELVSGPRDEARNVTDAKVRAAANTLSEVRTEGAQKVANAYRTLLSSELEALPQNANTDAVPPLISGTYTCGTEGTYTITFFRSGAKSGYSYRLSGLESGTYTAYAESPAPLGTCGLSLQLDAESTYGDKIYEVRIPNARGSSYATNYNAYILTERERVNAVREAENALDTAQREATLANALPREEALTRAQGVILQAEARLGAIDARIKERVLRAPFRGVINDSGLTPGEVSSGKSMTLVASDIFELTVRIPEIDITRVALGQTAEVRFDARPDDTVRATIDFISPTATLIDGVAYFEATLRFDTPPSWFRGGLNADVDIIVNETTNTLKVPKRFLVRENEASFVLIPDGIVTKRVPVEVAFTGNDGFIGITGNIKENDTIIAP